MKSNKMQVFRSIKSNIQTQGFYDNKVSYYKEHGMLYHGAYDFYAENGESLYFDCSCKGFVLNTEIDSSGGLGLNIITETLEGIFKHRYWHLKDFVVKAGDWVETGDLIGHCDNTGYSTNPHLHRDMKEMIKDNNGAYRIKYPDNGSYGTVPWDRWFINIWAVDQMENLKKTLANLQQQVSLWQKLINLWKTLIKWVFTKAE